MDRAETITLIAGQDIDTISAGYPLAVFLLPDYSRADSSYAYQYSNTSFQQVYGDNWIKQSVSSIRDINQVSNITLNLIRTGTPSGNIVMDLWYFSDKNDGTGSDEGWVIAETVTKACSSISDSSPTNYVFKFAPAAIHRGDVMIVVSVPNGDSSNYINVAIGDTITYWGLGNPSFETSSDAGSSWSGVDDVFMYFDLEGLYVSFDTEERVYLSDFYQNSYDEQKMRFTGFAITGQGISTGNPIKVQTNGIIDGFSGLKPGKIYYPSNTAVGEIVMAPLEDGESSWYYNRFAILRALTATRGQILSNNDR